MLLLKDTSFLIFEKIKIYCTTFFAIMQIFFHIFLKISKFKIHLTNTIVSRIISVLKKKGESVVNLIPNQTEILRYLGHRGQDLDSQTKELLDHCIKTMTETVKPRFCYAIFSLEKTDRLSLSSCSLELPGNDIQKHLAECDQCVLLGATLGIEADNLIRVSETESMTRALILDAVATDLIEQVCDHAEEEIRKALQKDNLYLTPRFSPGYGDLPITLQNRISAILDTPRKIGLTVTEHALMIPRKSVTAIIGLTKTPCRQADHHCTLCAMKGTCQFQKEDISYES